ncbi:TetR/AcrR family transcriptional regulator [Streptomyces sp. SDr-06]|uniref:TetR/AcrR family transcriptional regulator n=1 Tax=Streptomyces sp. SDr-06 TaxID=2267702 RepID=UPI000DE9E92E|nr:TetR/AcrR family transcriptional regulator [Streptomyces sp. SDr-06]RCH70186.1 TetR/AcrR family transcriptional regulator [Streptomyces sp. SDr-06]
MTVRRRLSPDERRRELVDTGARLFAAKPYDDVLMEDVAEQAGVSRALLYRYFPNKGALFAAIYQRASDRLLDGSPIDPALSLRDQLSAGLDVHFDYFAANRHTVLAANRVLAGDPVIQAIIDDELAELSRRVLDATGLEGRTRDTVSAALTAWLVFVRALCLDWLTNETFSRAELHAMAVGALRGALGAVTDVDRLLGPPT